MGKISRDQLPKWKYYPAEPERDAAVPPDRPREISPEMSDAEALAEDDESGMQDDENAQNGAYQNETIPNDESQPIEQQEDMASVSEIAEKILHHVSPEEGDAASRKGKKRKRRDDGRLITYDQEGILLRALGRGATLRAAAAQAKCHHSTVSRLMQQDELFAARVESSQEDLKIELIHQLRFAGKQDWRAAARLLEYLDKRTQRTQA